MIADSDPALRRQTAPERAEWADHVARNLVAMAPAAIPVPRSRLQGAMARGVVIVAAGLLALRAVAGWLAEPLVDASTAAPAWTVEVTSSSERSLLALAYGREAGFHIVRVPGMNASTDPRVIPARLARGELHLMSLGLSKLRAHSVAPRGLPASAWSAEARTITAFQRPDAMGVRTSW